jgi:hypothetical protein
MPGKKEIPFKNGTGIFAPIKTVGVKEKVLVFSPAESVCTLLKLWVTVPAPTQNELDA